jgi:hypothetical protein
MKKLAVLLLGLGIDGDCCADADRQRLRTVDHQAGRKNKSRTPTSTFSAARW